MLKKILIFVLIIFSIKAQNVSITEAGTPPDPSAILDLQPDLNYNKGLLIPRLTTTQRNSISTPAQYLMIWNTTTNCLEAYIGSTWQAIFCGCSGPPAAPTANAASGITNNSFIANWNSVSGATGYSLDVATDAGFTNILPSYNGLYVGNTVIYNVTGLNPCTTYYYRIRASNSCGSSVYSNIINVTTLYSCPSLSAWLYKIPVTINNSGTFLANYQVMITLNTQALVASGKMNVNGNDIRVTDSDKCTPLNFWIEEGTMNTTNTIIWVKVPSVPTGNKLIYVYYGNAAATNSSDGFATFNFFDDFTIFNPATWSISGGGSYSASTGSVTVSLGALYTNNTVSSHPNKMVEARVRWTSPFTNYSGLNIADVQGTTGSNTAIDKVCYLMTEMNPPLDRVGAWAANGTVAGYNIVPGTLQFTAVSGTTYIIGHSISGTNVTYYKDRSMTGLYTGTWAAPFYIFLGHFMGASGSAANCTDITVDWVLVREYVSNPPTAVNGTEEAACL